MPVPNRVAWVAALAVLGSAAVAQPPTKAKKAAKEAGASETFPPALPGGQRVVTDTSADFLKPPAGLKAGVAIAATAPTVDFQYFPCQTYPGKPWSNWGNGSFARGKYYTAIGDHRHPAGNAFVFEYDPGTKKLRQVGDIQGAVNLPDGHYVASKIHSYVDMGSDGLLYYSTHRGSPAATTEKNHYKGDWILRTDPATGKAEVVAHAPVPMHAVPNGRLDPDRLIFYGGTAAAVGREAEGIRFFAYDVKNGKLLYAGPEGPARSMILARSTGRVYYTQDKAAEGAGQLMRYDPASGGLPVPIPGKIGIRAATRETPAGIVYTASSGQGGIANLYAFDVKTETVRALGPAAVASNQYVASIDADPTGRYLYYVPGAHGGSERDGSAVVQYDTTTGSKKVIAFLHPYYKEKYELAPAGTYSVVLDDKGETLFVTWNVNRGGKAWDCCGLTAIHIPASERRP